MDMNLTRLPLGTPEGEPHIPILTSNNVHTASRVILYVGEAVQDLGILAYRIAGKENLASGSVINFIKAVQAEPDHPGLVIANPGQLIWHRRGGKAMTLQTWHCLPKKTEVSAPLMLSKGNFVEGHRDTEEHIASFFDAVEKMVKKNAKLDIIGMGHGALEMIAYLQDEYDRWSGRVDAIVVGANNAWNVGFTNEKFKEFWGKVT
jgi:hypothetical protein